MTALPAPGSAVAEQLARIAAGLSAERLPGALRQRCLDLVLDIGGLCVAARREPYVRALIDSPDGDGPCTAVGHAPRFSAAQAALVNGTAPAGEEFYDPSEGGPVHPAAVVPAPAVFS